MLGTLSSYINMCGSTVAAKYFYEHYIVLAKTTAAQDEDALSYHRVRGLYYRAVVFAATI